MAHVDLAVRLDGHRAHPFHRAHRGQAAFPADSKQMIDALGADDLTTTAVRGLRFGGRIAAGEPVGNELVAAEFTEWPARRY